MRINPMTFDNIGSWSWPIKIGFFGICLFIIAFMIFFIDMRPLNAKIKTEKINQKLLLDKFQKEKNLTAMLPTLLTQTMQIKKSYSQLLSLLPLQWDLPGMIQVLSTQATHQALELKMIKPSAEILTPAYAILPIRLSVQGSYENLKRFIINMIKIRPIVTIDNITLYTMPEETNRLTSVNQVLLQLHLTVYMYRQLDKSSSQAIPTLPTITNIREPLTTLPITTQPNLPTPSKFNPFHLPSALAQDVNLNMSQDALQRYPLAKLVMVGTLIQDAQTWGLILTPDNVILHVKVGDYLGQTKARVVAISLTDMTLTEKTNPLKSVPPSLIHLALKTVSACSVC